MSIAANAPWTFLKLRRSGMFVRRLMKAESRPYSLAKRQLRFNHAVSSVRGRLESWIQKKILPEAYHTLQVVCGCKLYRPAISGSTLLISTNSVFAQSIAPSITECSRHAFASLRSAATTILVFNDVRAAYLGGCVVLRKSANLFEALKNTTSAIAPFVAHAVVPSGTPVTRKTSAFL